MGEDSMTGRPLWAWFRHRIEERRTLPIIEADRAENDDLPNTDDVPFPSSICEISWGSIPLVYSFGDCHQLPPVGMKPISDL